MSKKIMVLFGSPRKKGNTRRVVDWFAEGATGAGASVEVIDTARLRYKTLGCLACMNCKKSNEFECAVDDDAKPILARLRDVDVIVMATPVYWFAPTAQLKVFTDRIYSLAALDSDTGNYNFALKGKTMALIATAGGDLEGSGLHIVNQTFKTAAEFQNMKYDSFLVPSAPVDPEEMDKDEGTRKEAQDFGRKLAVQ